MRVERDIALRYLVAKRRSSFVSVITVFCVLGIIIGVTILITVLSVMNGFQSGIRDRILETRSHININSLSSSGLRNYRKIMDTAKQNPQVTSVTPMVEMPAILQTGTQNVIVNVLGVPHEMFTNDSYIAGFIKFTTGYKVDMMRRNSAVIGTELAKRYGLSLGDNFSLVTSLGKLSTGNFNAATTIFNVSGIYKTGYYEYDAKLIITPLGAAQRIGGIGDNVSAVGVKIKNYFRADKVAREIDEALNRLYVVNPWMFFDRNLFSALHNEKLILGILLSFIILMAALNIAVTQIVFVKDKRREIAILKTLGLKPFNVAGVFFLEGTFMGAVGTMLGVGFGLLLANNVNESLEALRGVAQFILDVVYFIPTRIFAFIQTPDVPEFFPKSVYYLDKLPSVIDNEQVLTVALISFFLTVIFAVIPSYMASRIKPAQVLRNE